MNLNLIINLSYLVSAALFVFGLKLLSSPVKARRGNILSAIGMLIAVVVTLLNQEIIDYKWILISIVIGSAIGIIYAKFVAMTAMPEMVALLNGF